MTDTAAQRSLSLGQSVFESAPFTFVIGQNDLSVTLPTLLVSRCSQPLERLIDSSMKEATERKAHLQDTDFATLVRFAEYLHTGQYHNAVLLREQSISSDCHELSDPPSNDVDSDWRWTTKSKGKTNKTPGSEELKRKTDLRIYLAGLTTRPPPSLLIEDEGCPGQSDVLKAHVLVYAFADQYDVEGLRHLAVTKLYDALALLDEDFDSARSDFTAFIDCVYSHTVERSTGEPLRRLASLWAAERWLCLKSETEFIDILHQYPSAIVDIANHLADANKP